MKNPNIVTDKKCGKCSHYRKLRSGGDTLTGSFACHYCFDTGHPRGCTVDECLHGRKMSDAERKELRVSKFNPSVIGSDKKRLNK